MALVLGIFSPIIRNLAVDLDLPVVDDVVAGLLADDENGRAVSQFGDTALANESRSTQTLSDPIRNRLNNAQVVSVIEEVALRFPELSADTLGLIIILESHGNPQAYNPNLGRGGLLPQGTVNNGLSVEHQGEQLVRYFQELQARLGGNGQLPSDPAVLYALILNPSLPVYGDEPMVPEMSVFPSGSFPNYAPYEMLTVGQLHEDLLNLKRELGLEPYPLDNQTP